MKLPKLYLKYILKHFTLTQVSKRLEIANLMVHCFPIN